MAAGLDDLRSQIREIDDEILRLSQARLALAKKVGAYKLEKGLPIKDFKIEKKVFERSRLVAEELGLDPDLASAIAELQINFAVKTQEEFHSRARPNSTQESQTIAIFGVRGKMGYWLQQFFESFGHKVIGIDVGTDQETLTTAVESADFIALATPMSTTDQVVDTLVALQPKGIVFDVCSLKTPISQSIARAASAGLAMASIHPMFGPDVKLLSGRNIVICETSSKSSTEAVERLFSETTANIVRVPLEKHDEFMGFVLGMSHIMNLAYAKVLTDSDFDFEEFARVASSSFLSQLAVVNPIVNENQDLYYEIQALNSHTPDLIDRIIDSLETYLKTIKGKDRDTFKAYMEQSRQFFSK